MIVALAMLCFGFPVAANAEPNKEELVKTAMLYNFILFAEWTTGTNGWAKQSTISYPEDDQPLEVCVFQGSAIIEALPSLKGKMVQKRSLSLKVLPRKGPSEACDIVYLEAKQSQFYFDSKVARNPRALTVVDNPGADLDGPIVQLFEAEGRIKFRINIDRSTQAGIKFSSKLLSLAEVVGG